MFAHRGDVTSLTCTTSCIISSGLDDLSSIWDCSTGIKFYSIQQDLGCDNLLILVLDNAAIVCNFGSELSLVYVPSVLEKLD
ncbi:hypothetical protein P7K49_021204 [Saguinus oedipus]|uniref:Uncharacterized protein n=1 Tax=Saguinus oedipus TaxID=9490 RepID=A0ABQ9US28_SAGOE|nr:hypothetical protein P7K49_021202 [Saguinus oedipus]KAK2099856.1 hypothetical protein P7K49_021204 [Saguinus oedipus]